MLNDLLVKPTMTVKEVVLYMETKNIKAVIVVDADNFVLGLFTLGDMRHYFLNNGDLLSRITEAMNPHPITFLNEKDAEEMKKNKELIIYPIVDENGKIINAIYKNDINCVSEALQHVPVVIMAGGKGTRLYPYTKILPKALMPIGDLTITERIINSFQRYGCNDFHMVLNHKAEMIKSYYNDLKKNYSISFVTEDKFLGTGGGLAYLKGKLDKTFFLSNCDILINADFECIYKTHKREKNKITFVCAMKDIVIPYGIVETNASGKIISMKEKPEFSFLTNTGLYVVEPEVIEEIEENEFIHLPDIAQRYMNKGEKVGVFPISEKAWMDMGQFSEMESMLKELGIER